MRLTVPAAIAAASVTVLLLAGCGNSTPAASPTAAAELKCVDTVSGKASDSVKVSGEFGKKPTVTVPAPLEVKKTERTVVIEGTGDETAPGDNVSIEISMYNASTGELVQETTYAGGAPQVPVDATQLVPALVRAIECLPVGSRVVAVSPASEAFGEKGSSDGKIAPGIGIVIVADILSIRLDRADGTAVAPVAGMPTVKLDDSGAPTVTIPKAEPSAELKLANLIQGDGEVVKDGDTVTVQYQGVIWRTGEIFDQSWGKQPAQFQTGQVIPGFTKALVGQKIGSQVIVVIPPDQGYGAAGNAQAGIEGTDTLVFVVDILATSR